MFPLQKDGKKINTSFCSQWIIPTAPHFYPVVTTFSTSLSPPKRSLSLRESPHESRGSKCFVLSKMQSFFELWANNDRDSVKFMGLLYFVSHQKYLKAKSKNHLSECVYGGWAFAPVGFMCLLDFTVTVFLIGADWLLHLPEEHLFQFIWGDDFSRLQLASYLHSSWG